MMRTLVIAELGSTHDGNITTAIKMIMDAAEAGADYVKLQYWSSAKRLADRRRSGAHYEAIYAKYQIPVDWLPALRERTNAAGLGFMCTSYLEEDIATVAPYVDHFKVSSFEAGDMDFILAHYRFLYNSTRWLIVSTGLQADATLQYALGYQSDEKSWWKKVLYNEDKLVNSPYNTYKNVGLPPKPISNPGLASINAVAHPQDSDYFYYLHDPSGGVHYARTLDEHNENINKYLLTQ